MFFSEKQKMIIRAVKKGTVFDIRSYVKQFQPERIVNYDWLKVQLRFRRDPEAVNRYCPWNLCPIPANFLSEEEYQQQIAAGRPPENYICFTPELKKDCGNWNASALGSRFSFDFYQGVRVLDSFDDLIDFLAVWQFLRNEGLVLEVPQTLDAKTVGLFFKESRENITFNYEADQETGTIIFSDQRYLENHHRLSEQHMAVCQYFLDKRLYPAPQLNLFIQNGFRTNEERMHSQAMTAAWAAVIISVVIAIIQSCS